MYVYVWLDVIREHFQVSEITDDILMEGINLNEVELNPGIYIIAIQSNFYVLHKKY